MDKILQLHDSNADQLAKHLESISPKNLCTLWEDCVCQRPSHATTLLSAMLRGLPCEATQSREKVFTCALTQIQRGELTTKLTTEILGVLILETAQLPVEQLAKLSSTLIGSLKSGQYGPGKWLELFPHAVSCIATRDDVPCDDGDIVTGREFKSHVIDDLCSTKWPHTFVASLAAMFKDLHLTENELKFAFDKLFEMMREMEYNSVPPLVYQLLELSFKGHRQMVLEELFKFFNGEEARVGEQQESDDIDSESVVHGSDRRDELKRCEGTSLLHVLFAVRYDHDLGRELVKLFRNYRLLPEKLLTPFTLSVAFCIASDKTFQQPIFDVLKVALTNSYKENTLKENSFWIRGMTGDGHDPQEVIVTTAKNAGSDWDHVLTGLVEFAFMLLDTYGENKRAFGKEQTEIGHKMCRLGSTVLLNIFKENRAVRLAILMQILNHILPSESTSTDHYLELLSKSIRVSSQAYLEQLERVRAILDYLGYFPASVATRLLEALQPLLKVSSTFRDGTLLVLRKVMFMRQLDARKIAVSGFFLFLRNFKVIRALSSSGQSFQGSQSSQLLADVHVRGNSGNNEALCLEVLGILRRSLSQQVDVRLTLYRGLPKVLDQSPHLTDAILDLLLKQANQFIEAGAMPPLKLKQCVQEHGSQQCLTEPLPFLIKCIYACLEIATLQHSNTETEDEEPWTHPLSVLLQDFVKAMIKAELEDFELDESADYSADTVIGKKNYLMATQVIEVYEVLIEYSFVTNGYKSGMANEVAALFDTYQKLISTAKAKSSSTKKIALNADKGTKKKRNEGNHGKGGRKKQTSASSIPIRQTSLLSESFLVVSLKALVFDKTPANHEALSLLREKTDFQEYLINAAIQKIDALDTIAEDSTLDESELFNYCSALGRILLHFYADKRAEKSSVLLSCVNGFTSALSIICNRFSSKLDCFLKKLEKDMSRSDSLQSKKRPTTSLESVMKKLQHLVDSALDQSGEASSFKLAASLLQAVQILVRKLTSDGQQPSLDTINWMESTLKREPIDDAVVLKALLSVAFQMKRQTADHLDMIKKLTEDVHRLLGDVDEDVHLTNGNNFRTIGKEGASSVVLAIIEELNICQANVSWVVTTLRARLSTNDRKDVSNKGRQSKQNKICTFLVSVAIILYELLTSAHKAGAGVEAVIRFATRYYATVSNVTKYFTSIHAVASENLSSRLEKLVATLNTQVTPKVYPFLTYIQETTSGAQRRNQKTNAIQSDVARAKKEAKLIPTLIYNVEQYERFLIQLSKKPHMGDLTSTMKMSTNRDFRINTEFIDKAQEGSDDPQEEMDVDDDDEEADRCAQDDTTREVSNNDIQTSPPRERESPSSSQPSKRRRKSVATNTPSRRSLAPKSPKLF